MENSFEYFLALFRPFQIYQLKQTKCIQKCFDNKETYTFNQYMCIVLPSLVNQFSNLIRKA